MRFGGWQATVFRQELKRTSEVSLAAFSALRRSQ